MDRRVSLNRHTIGGNLAKKGLETVVSDLVRGKSKESIRPRKESKHRDHPALC